MCSKYVFLPKPKFLLLNLLKFMGFLRLHFSAQFPVADKHKSVDWMLFFIILFYRIIFCIQVSL